MSSPTPKRRKTSPLPDVDSRAASPAKSASRASYLSPTKASLARFNPSLLPRPTSAGATTSRPTSGGEVIAPGEQARAYVLNEFTEGPRQDTAPKTNADPATVPSPQDAISPVNVTPRARRTGLAERTEDDEADLPATPSTKGLEQDTPRRGILYSSPSKRPPRHKGSAKPSPLKQKQKPIVPNVEPRTEEDTVEGHARPDDAPRKAQKPPPEPPNPELEKKRREEEDLESQLQALQEDVRRYEGAVERMQGSSPNEDMNDAEIEELITLINKAADSNNPDTVEERPGPLSTLLSSFLPFAPPPLAGQKLEQKSDKPVPSHSPLDVEDPLPYLRLFTSFTYTSELTIPGIGMSLPTEERLQQIHTVDMVGPSKLLSLKLVIRLDSVSQKVTELTILRLSPWAERELGTYMRKKALEGDLGAVCWALNSYWDLSVRRAAYWAQCERVFARYLPGNKENARDDPRSIKKRSRQQREMDDDEDEEVSEVADGPQDGANGNSGASQLSRVQLQRHLGRDRLILQSSEVLFKIAWDIEFDWTGQAESRVEGTAAFPQVWHEADSRGSLKKVAGTFDALVQDRGVFEATRAMAGLLFA